jgi:hypothetical protein
VAASPSSAAPGTRPLWPNPSARPRSTPRPYVACHAESDAQLGRLDALTAGRGIRLRRRRHLPCWYHHLFTAPDAVVARWLTKVAGVLRSHDLPVSSAHVIEATRLAETLAALRGRPLAGLAEVSEATRAVLCEGNEAAAAFVQRDLVVGELLGAVPAEAPSVPLEADLRAQARSLRLRIDPLEKPITLDPRKDHDRRSRSSSIALPASASTGGPSARTTSRGTGTFRETWTLRWRPELAVAIVDAALWGTTIGDAANAKLLDQARTATDLRTVTEAVEHALLADLADALPEVLALVDSKAAVDADVTRLMAAIPALVRAVRYGDVRGTDTASMSTVVDALMVRVCSGLPAAVTSLSDEAATTARAAIDAVHRSLAAHARTAGGAETRERWIETLGLLVDRRDLHGLLPGRIVRLFDGCRGAYPAGRGSPVRRAPFDRRRPGRQGSLGRRIPGQERPAPRPRRPTAGGARRVGDVTGRGRVRQRAAAAAADVRRVPVRGAQQHRRPAQAPNGRSATPTGNRPARRATRGGCPPDRRADPRRGSLMSEQAPDRERLRRWRLLPGSAAQSGLAGNAGDSLLDRSDQAIDAALAALYETEARGPAGPRSAGLGASAPSVARWLGDIRMYFPSSVVQVMQHDAIDRLNLKQLLLEPEMLGSLEPDVHLAGTLLSLNRLLPERA